MNPEKNISTAPLFHIISDDVKVTTLNLYGALVDRKIKTDGMTNGQAFVLQQKLIELQFIYDFDITPFQNSSKEMPERKKKAVQMYLNKLSEVFKDLGISAADFRDGSGPFPHPSEIDLECNHKVKKE